MDLLYRKAVPVGTATCAMLSPCVGLRAQVDNALHPDGLPLYPCGVAWLALPMTASFASIGHWSLLCPYYLGIAASHEVQSVD